MKAALARHPTMTASAGFALLALILTGPALVGRAALGPDIVLDWDPLYRTQQPPPPLPYSSDYTPIVCDHPQGLAFARGLHAGRLDRWNPLSGAGAPLWADHIGPFFPLRLPFYLAPSRETYHLFLALRLAFAAIGAYLLARRRGLSPIGAFAAGASLELSGTMIAQLPFGTGSASYVLPWVILGSFLIADNPTAASAAAAGIALGLAGSGGHPPLILLTFAGFAAAIAGHMVSSWRHPRRAAEMAVWGTLAVVLGLALAAPSLLPLAELASVASSYKHRLMGSLLRVWQFSESRSTLPIALFAPGLFQSLHPRFQTVFAFAPAIGVLGLVAATVGVLAGGLDAALAAIAVLGVALATAPPGLAWVQTLPGLHLILPTNAWPLVVLPLTQALGRGVETLSTPRGRRLALIAGVAVILVGGSSLMLVKDAPPKMFASSLRAAVAEPGGWVRLAWPAAFAAAVLAACVGLQRMRFASWCAFGLTVAIVLELAITMVPFTRQPPTRALSSAPSPAVQFLRHALASGDARMTGIPYVVGYPLTPMLFELPDLRGTTALPIRRYYDYLHAVAPKAGSYTVQDAPVASSPLLDLAAVRYLVLPGPYVMQRGRPLKEALLLIPPERPQEDDPDTPVAYQDDYVVVYENRAALPRVRIVHDAIVVPDEAAALERMKSIVAHAGHARDAGVADTVVLEPDSNGQNPPAVSGGDHRTETVRIVDQSDPDRLVLEASLESPGFVVIADTYYPGWTASVDGNATAIFPANLMFRAIFVPSGSHAIVLRYQPRSFLYGCILFCTAAVVCMFMLRPRGARKERGEHG